MVKSGNKKSISCNKTKNATLQKPKKPLLFKLCRLHSSLPKNVAVNRRLRQSEYSDFNGNGSCDGFSPNFPLILYPAVKHASACAESVLLRWVTVKKNTLSNILFILIISAAPINVNKAKEFKDKVQKFNEKV